MQPRITPWRWGVVKKAIRNLLMWPLGALALLVLILILLNLSTGGELRMRWDIWNQVMHTAPPCLGLFEIGKFLQIGCN